MKVFNIAFISPTLPPYWMYNFGYFFGPRGTLRAKVKVPCSSEWLDTNSLTRCSKRDDSMYAYVPGRSAPVDVLYPRIIRGFFPDLFGYFGPSMFQVYRWVERRTFEASGNSFKLSEALTGIDAMWRVNLKLIAKVAMVLTVMDKAVSRDVIQWLKGNFSAAVVEVRGHKLFDEFLLSCDPFAPRDWRRIAYPWFSTSSTQCWLPLHNDTVRHGTWKCPLDRMQGYPGKVLLWWRKDDILESVMDSTINVATDKQATAVPEDVYHVLYMLFHYFRLCKAHSREANSSGMQIWAFSRGSSSSWYDVMLYATYIMLSGIDISDWEVDEDGWKPMTLIDRVELEVRLHHSDYINFAYEILTRSIVVNADPHERLLPPVFPINDVFAEFPMVADSQVVRPIDFTKYPSWADRFVAIGHIRR
jgi:hypothetical protein